TSRPGGVGEELQTGFRVLQISLGRKHLLPHLVHGEHGVVQPAVVVGIGILTGLTVIEGLTGVELGLSLTLPLALSQHVGDLRGIATQQYEEADQQEASETAADGHATATAATLTGLSA